MTLEATAEAAGLALFRRVWRRRCLEALHTLRDSAHSSSAAARTRASVHTGGNSKQRAPGTGGHRTAGSLHTTEHAARQGAAPATAANRCCSSPLQPKNLSRALHLSTPGDARRISYGVGTTPASSAAGSAARSAGSAARAAMPSLRVACDGVNAARESAHAGTPSCASRDPPSRVRSAGSAGARSAAPRRNGPLLHDIYALTAAETTVAASRPSNDVRRASAPLVAAEPVNAEPSVAGTPDVPAPRLRLPDTQQQPLRRPSPAPTPSPPPPPPQLKLEVEGQVLLQHAPSPSPALPQGQLPSGALPSPPHGEGHWTREMRWDSPRLEPANSSP